MGNETTALTVINDDTGYEYDLMKLPDKSAPLICEASGEILQDMQVDSIIQNLENVARLMYVAYNALGGTMVQSKMSGLQKKYLDLMDESGRAITAFERNSKDICNFVSQAYKWLIKGKESMAVSQFDKCAKAAADMANRAEHLADGFLQLSNDAENVLEHTQDEQALQYKKMDELKAQMEQYNAKLESCKSLRDSLNEDINSINKVYQDAKKKEQSAFDMKKGLMITQIVTSCIGALIPSAKSIKNSGGGENSKAAAEAQNSLNKNQEKKDELAKQKELKQSELNSLKEQKTALEKEIQTLQQKIEVEQGVTARSDEEREKNLAKYNAELKEKQAALADIENKIQNSTGELQSTDSQLDEVTAAINTLNQQLSAYAEQCRDDLARAEAAAEKALEKKMELEKTRRETLASIQEFTVLIQSSVRMENVAETAVQTLQVAIRCIKQVVVALTTAAKFWRSMEEYCRSLSESGLGKVIKKLSDGLSLEERMEFYQDTEFMMTLLVYICRWAALYYVCADYKRRSEQVRAMVADNMQSSSSREEEWKMAGELAQEMSVSIGQQVEASKKISASLPENLGGIH